MLKLDARPQRVEIFGQDEDDDGFFPYYFQVNDCPSEQFINIVLKNEDNSKINFYDLEVAISSSVSLPSPEEDQHDKKITIMNAKSEKIPFYNKTKYL